MTALLKPTETDAPHGLIRGLTMERYQRHPALSRSMLDEIKKSPAHLKWLLANPREDTEAFRTGRLMHSALLEPETFWPTVVVWEEGIRRGKKWDEFQERHAGKTIITADDELMLAAASESLKRRPIARMLRGEIEASLFWRCPRTELMLKARPDVIGADGVVYDVKTTADASLEAFQRSAYRYGYHRQAAWYLDAVELVTGQKPADFVFIVVEKCPPFEVRIFVADEAFVEAGRRENERNLDLFASCLKADHWPGYDDEPQRLTLPAWSFEGDAE